MGPLWYDGLCPAQVRYSMVTCIWFGVDNTSVNVSLQHSIMTQLQQKNDKCYFVDCPCHAGSLGALKIQVGRPGKPTQCCIHEVGFHAIPGQYKHTQAHAYTD